MVYSSNHIFSEKDILIASLQEDLESATNREMTSMSRHEETAAILPLHYSTSTNYDDEDDDNMQEMCQVCCHGDVVAFIVCLFGVVY